MTESKTWSNGPGKRRPSSLSGLLPVLQTPFSETEDIDFAALEGEIEWVYRQGAKGVVIGMVSEVLRLSSDERDLLAASVCKASGTSGPVVVSVGAESTVVAVRHAQHAEAVGAGAIMATPPLLIAAEPDELRRYYERLLGAVSLPLVVQDASGYMGQSSGLPIDLMGKLQRDFDERILFKPEAPPLGPRVSKLRQATGGRARILDGSGGIALVDSYKRGVVGTMPAAEMCWAVGALWDALGTGDAAMVDAISGPLAALVSLQPSLDAFVAIEKHLLVRQGVLPSSRARGPHAYLLDQETRAEVDRLFDLLESVVKGAGRKCASSG